MSRHRSGFDLFGFRPGKDPGNAGTFQVDASPLSFALVSAAAETRTLGRPFNIGTIVNIGMKTDGGDITMTVTGGYNENGDTTFVFSDPGQFILLISEWDGTNYFWRKIADHNTGNAAPAAGFYTQAAPTALTTSATLTAAQLLNRLFTANQGGGAAATYTLPLATDLETALAAAMGRALAVNDAFEWSLTNISTVAAEDITIATAAGWTLVGKMTVESNAAVTDDSRGVFIVRRTAANTYTLYRKA